MLKRRWTGAGAEAVGGVNEMYGSGGRVQSRGAAVMVVMTVASTLIASADEICMWGVGRTLVGKTDRV